jgi:rRNA maturation endonuclease Nob1
VVAGRNEDTSTTSKRRRTEPVQDSQAELLPEASSLIASRPKRTIRRTEKAKAADDNVEEAKDVGELSGTDYNDVKISSDNYSD